MAVNTCEMSFNGIKIAFPKTYKNRPAAGVSATIPPSVMRLSHTGLVNTSPKLDIGTF